MYVAVIPVARTLPSVLGPAPRSLRRRVSTDVHSVWFEVGASVEGVAVGVEGKLALAPGFVRG